MSIFYRDVALTSCHTVGLMVLYTTALIVYLFVFVFLLLN